MSDYETFCEDMLILQKTIKICPQNKAFLIVNCGTFVKILEANFQRKEDCFSI